NPVEASALVHLFGDVIHIQRELAVSNALGRALLSAVSQVTLVGTITSAGHIHIHAGVGADWTVDRLLSSKGSSDLGPGSVSINGSGMLDAGRDVRVVTGEDIAVQATSELGDGQTRELVPVISEEPAVISIVTGARTVADGFILVPEIHWVETQVVEQVGTETVKIGDLFHTMDVTLTQDGYYNASTQTQREWFVQGTRSDCDYRNSSISWGSAGEPADDATFNDLNDAQRQRVLNHLGYKPLFDFGYANAKEYRVINGSPSVSNWTPSWKNNAKVIVRVTQISALRDKWIRMPSGALSDMLRMVSQGDPTTFRETVGSYRDYACATRCSTAGG
ncbi:MAG: hypothetical protein HOC74_41350, partial [Gemmatimonadetes bacterium]|nr:hypothetical protein [Gemmatimonadota bacterium]